ncbi:MAG: biotin synthase, partial [Firmicutes bacterium]|nr:biotin synthase [Bacillota bacterium]
RIGVVLKRAQYFILCSDNPRGLKLDRETTVRALIDPKIFTFGAEQLSLFDGTAVRALPPAAEFSPAGAIKSVAAGVEEAVLCLAGKL